MKKNNKEFTLIELLLVIVILTILSLVTITIVLNIIDNSKKKSDLKSLEDYASTLETTLYNLNSGGITELNDESLIQAVNSVEYTGAIVYCDNKEINDGRINLDSCKVGNNTGYCYKNGKAIYGNKCINSNTDENLTSTIVFGSDYQEDLTVAPGFYRQNETGIILNAIKNDGIIPNLIVYLGDYQGWPIVQNNTFSGMDELKNLTKNYFSMSGLVFIEGNHDYNDYNSSMYPFISSGKHEYSNYILYVINYNDFMYDMNFTVNSLSSYLNSLDTDKLIIILSHVPLHSSTRGDNDESYKLFNILNYYSNKLNIIYLFGHNHSLGYDVDIGGSVIYKGIGDSIKIKNDIQNIENKKLKFTYMNAGYIGYYNDDTSNLSINKDNYTYSKELTMSVFEINDDNISIKRYSKNGIYMKYMLNLD